MDIKNTIARRVIKSGLRLAFKLPSLLPLPVTSLRMGMEQGARLFPVRDDIRIEPVFLAGIPAERLSPPLKTDIVILHFHGGAFMAGSTKTHRAMGAELAARANAVVYMLDYRLAPEHPYPAPLHDGLAAYQALLAQGHPAQQIVLGGDSGGCALILSLALALREQKLPQPAALFMISPYVDLTLSSDSVSKHQQLDPMTTAYALRRGADGYRSHIPANDPRVSPLFADLSQLPATLIQAGSEEILHDDAINLARKLNAAGTEADCCIYKDMWHNFQMFSRFISEADTALDDIGRFVHQHTH